MTDRQDDWLEDPLDHAERETREILDEISDREGLDFSYRTAAKLANFRYLDAAQAKHGQGRAAAVEALERGARKAARMRNR